MQYSHMGLQFAMTLLVFVFGGHWLERRFSFAPFGIVIGALFGFAIALYQLLKMAKEMERRLEENDSD